MKHKPYDRMTTAELREATREFDKPFVRGRPPSAKGKALLRQAGFYRRKKLGRPVVGQGSVRVLFTVERGLLARADLLAKKRGLKRSELIAQGLQKMLSRAG